MARRAQLVIPLMLFLVAAVTGCAERYSVQTTLLPDGSVERAVDQPAASFPAAARAAPGWAAPPRQDPPAPENERKAVEQVRPDRPRVTASGRFPSIDAVPDHLVVDSGGRPAAKDPTAVSRLVRARDASDHVFVSAHTYRETLTEVVTADGCRQARAELIAGGGEFVEAVAAGLAGGEYDASGLSQWLRTEGKAWADELTETAALHAAATRHRARFDEPDRDGLAAAAVKLSAAHGLDLSDGHGGRLPADEMEPRIKGFVVNLLVRTVRRKRDGRPIDAATAERWFALVSDLIAGKDEGKADPEAQQLRAAIEGAARKVSERHGGPEAFGERVQWLASQVVGVYGLSVLSRHQFEFTLRVPGPVVMADGELLDDDRVRWRFEGREAWPAGYDMTCRYLQPDDALQRKVLGGVPLRTRGAMVEYVELLGASDAVPNDGLPGGTRVAASVPAVARRSLRTVIEWCVKAGSVEPLRTQAADLARTGPPARKALERCRRMMELLGVKA